MLKLLEKLGLEVLNVDLSNLMLSYLDLDFLRNLAFPIFKERPSTLKINGKKVPFEEFLIPLRSKDDNQYSKLYSKGIVIKIVSEKDFPFGGAAAVAISDSCTILISQKTLYNFDPTNLFYTLRHEVTHIIQFLRDLIQSKNINRNLSHFDSEHYATVFFRELEAYLSDPDIFEIINHIGDTPESFLRAFTQIDDNLLPTLPHSLQNYLLSVATQWIDFLSLNIDDSEIHDAAEFKNIRKEKTIILNGFMIKLREINKRNLLSWKILSSPQNILDFVL
jgi:hypothetical protein